MNVFALIAIVLVLIIRLVKKCFVDQQNLVFVSKMKEPSGLLVKPVYFTLNVLNADRLLLRL